MQTLAELLLVINWVLWGAVGFFAYRVCRVTIEHWTKGRWKDFEVEFVAILPSIPIIALLAWLFPAFQFVPGFIFAGVLWGATVAAVDILLERPPY